MYLFLMQLPSSDLLKGFYHLEEFYKTGLWTAQRAVSLQRFHRKAILLHAFVNNELDKMVPEFWIRTQKSALRWEIDSLTCLCRSWKCMRLSRRVKKWPTRGKSNGKLHIHGIVKILMIIRTLLLGYFKRDYSTVMFLLQEHFL